MKKVTCKCDYSFDITYEKTIDLDAKSAIKEKIKNGSFLSERCPSCNQKVSVELETVFVWKSKKAEVVFIPENKRMECLAFCAGAVRTDVETNKKIKTPLLKKGQTPVIGYPELADRIAVLDAGLNPLIVEAVKFMVLSNGKNLDSKKIQMLFEKMTDANMLEFHVHGLREKEVAVMPIPMQVYEALAADYKQKKQAELFDALQLGAYISYKNIAMEDGDEAE